MRRTVEVAGGGVMRRVRRVAASRGVCGKRQAATRMMRARWAARGDEEDDGGGGRRVALMVPALRSLIR